MALLATSWVRLNIGKSFGLAAVARDGSLPGRDSRCTYLHRSIEFMRTDLTPLQQCCQEEPWPSSHANTINNGLTREGLVLIDDARIIVG